MGKEMTCKGNEYPGIATKSKAKEWLRNAPSGKSNELFSEGIAKKSKAAALNG